MGVLPKLDFGKWVVPKNLILENGLFPKARFWGILGWGGDFFVFFAEKTSFSRKKKRGLDTVVPSFGSFSDHVGSYWDHFLIMFVLFFVYYLFFIYIYIFPRKNPILGG